MGLRVIGIDATSKKQVVMDCGAEHFIDVTAHDDASIVKEVLRVTGGLGASAVLVCTASNKAYAQALDFLRFDGTLVCIGMPEGAPQPIAKSFPQSLVFKQANICGVAVGSRRDAIECLDFAARGIVKTHIRIEKMEKLTEVSDNKPILTFSRQKMLTGGVSGISRDERGEFDWSCGHRFAVGLATLPIGHVPLQVCQGAKNVESNSTVSKLECVYCGC